MTMRDELDISATAERVWELTIDIEGWPALTPTMTSVQRLDDDSDLRVGSRARVVQPRQRPRIWTVTQVRPLSDFEWEARVGPLTMTARHHIEPTAAGCRNTVEIDLSGFGSGLLGRLLRRQLAAALHTENVGFQRAAESSREMPGTATTES